MTSSASIGITCIHHFHQLGKRLIVHTQIWANVGIARHLSASVALANATRPQWRKTIMNMRDIWTLSSRGLIILAPISVALLQIDSVATSRCGRAWAVAAFMIALAGLLSSILFILGGTSLIQDPVKLRWLEASRRPEELRSIQFWSCLALPAVCAAWSLIFATATVLYIAIVPITSSSEKGKDSKFEMIAYAFSVALISALNGYFFFQVYCLKQIMA